MYLTTPESVAQSLLEEHWDRRLPVEPQLIAQRLGVDVRKFAYPVEILSGQFRHSDGKPTIFVNSADSKLRQRFTIAHELGHYMLKHGDVFDDPPVNFSAVDNDSVEGAANRFALELLVPGLAVDFLIKEQGLRDIDQLSRRLGVSEAALAYRLRGLRWLTI